MLSKQELDKIASQFSAGSRNDNNDLSFKLKDDRVFKPGQIRNLAQYSGRVLLLETAGRQRWQVIPLDQDLGVHFVHDFLVPPDWCESGENLMLRLWNRRIIKFDQLGMLVDQVDNILLKELSEPGDIYRQRSGVVFPSKEFFKYRRAQIEFYDEFSQPWNPDFHSVKSWKACFGRARDSVLAKLNGEYLKSPEVGERSISGVFGGAASLWQGLLGGISGTLPGGGALLGSRGPGNNDLLKKILNSGRDRGSDCGSDRSSRESSITAFDAVDIYYDERQGFSLTLESVNFSEYYLVYSPGPTGNDGVDVTVIDNRSDNRSGDILAEQRFTASERVLKLPDDLDLDKIWLRIQLCQPNP